MRIAKATLWLSCAAAVVLAFAWPFVISSDSASVAYRCMALVSLWGMLGAIVYLLACKVLRTFS